MQAIAIQLTKENQIKVIDEAERRYVFHTKKDTFQKYSRESKRDPLREVNEVGAEPAVAQLLNISPWNPHANAETDRERGDLDGIEVRHTLTASGDLWIKPTDSDWWNIVLVTGRFPNYMVRGWIPCSKGRKIGVIEEKQEDRPTLWVRWWDLNDPATLEPNDLHTNP